MHSAKVTIWAGGIVSPYFFENDIGLLTIVLTNELFRPKVNNLFSPELDNLGTNDLYFQLDNAMWHITHATLDILLGHILKFDVNWPPWS